MKGDELDRILDDGLASYSLQEPRTGLAGRVMSRVRADGARVRTGWFLMAVAAAAMACVVIAIVMWRSAPRPQPVAWAPVPAEKPAEKKVKEPSEVPHRDSSLRVEHARLPGRESFPTPSPLSPEERALVAFARRAPEAALQFAEPDKPLEIEGIKIRPIQIDSLQTGEIK